MGLLTVLPSGRTVRALRDKYAWVGQLTRRQRREPQEHDGAEYFEFHWLFLSWFAYQAQTVTGHASYGSVRGRPHDALQLHTRHTDAPSNAYREYRRGRSSRRGDVTDARSLHPLGRGAQRTACT